MKRLLIGIWTLKAILVRAQREERRAVEKALCPLTEYIYHYDSNVVRNMMLKVFLVRSQMETRNMTLDPGGRVIC